jgi:benzoylformate decarboxylase
MHDSGSADTTPVTVREAVFALFRDFGLTTIFGNPGSTELPMFRDFPADFRYVLGLQEAVVVGMADGFAQATQKAALVNLHAATGVGHALGNIFTAYRNETPLVITAGQQARSILPHEPFLFAKEATEFPKPYVKWSCEPARAEDVPAAIARAYYTAMQPPRGPTFVSIPVDDWDRLCAPIAPRAVSTTIAGDPARLADAAARLADAQRPAIVAGAQAARDGAWHALISLAERHRAPVWVAPMSGRSSFPENHPLFAGFLPAHRKGIVAALAGHDLVLVVGGPAFTYHVEGEGPFLPEGASLIQLTDDPNMAAWTPVGTSIVTGIRLGIEALLAGPAPAGRAMPAERRRARRLADERLTDAFLMQQIAALRPMGAVIVEEAPSTRGPMHDYLPITDEHGFYTCSSGGLGHGLPASVGVALGRPGTRVIAILGDGSAMYAIQGLWSAAQLALPIVFVIVKNRAYRALDDFAPQFGLTGAVGTALPDLDFVGLAQGHGVQALRVARATELDAALKTAFQSPVPILVEIEIAV